MKKVVRLVGIQIWAMFASIFSFKSNKRKNTRLLYSGLALFVLFFTMMSFAYCYGIGLILKMSGSIDALPPMMMTVTSLVVTITTMNKVKGTLFGFKDYDMIMALPVSTSKIVASRLILLYTFNMLFVFIVMVPTMIVYGILAKPSGSYYLVSSIMVFFIPFIPIMIASIIGTVIAYIASKFRHSNFINIVLTFTILIAIIVFSSAVKGTEADFAKVSEQLTEKANEIYPLAALYEKAVCNIDIRALGLFLAISTTVFLLYAIVVGKLFKKLNTMIVTNRTRANYKMQRLKQTTPVKALYRKEIKRYFSSNLYILNTGFGIVILTVGAIALCFIDLEKVIGEPQAVALLSKSTPIIISFCTIMCCTTMASISLEGKNLWIIKSLPISPKQIFIAKIAVNMTIIAPVFIDAIVISFILNIGFVDSIFMVLLPFSCALFIAILGLVMNLKFPNFNWTTETAVIKQGAATLIVTFTGMAIVGLPMIFIAGMPNISSALLLGGYTVILIGTSIALYCYLMNWGAKRFAEL